MNRTILQSHESNDNAFTHTNWLFKTLEKSPRQYLCWLNHKIITGQTNDLINHIKDYDRDGTEFGGNNALQCLCMVASYQNVQSLIPNNNYGIHTKYESEIIFSILDILIKYGVNIYHRDKYDEIALDYINDSQYFDSYWKIPIDFTQRVKNIYRNIGSDCSGSSSFNNLII